NELFSKNIQPRGQSRSGHKNRRRQISFILAAAHFKSVIYGSACAIIWPDCDRVSKLLRYFCLARATNRHLSHSSIDRCAETRTPLKQRGTLGPWRWAVWDCLDGLARHV